MGRSDKTCICCGKKYNFCLHCSEYDHLPRWMNIYHNENCKKLFNITTEYKAKNISAQEAKEAYEKCDLSYKNKLHKSIIDTINEVCKNNKKKFAKEKVIEEVIEEVVIEENVTETLKKEDVNEE